MERCYAIKVKWHNWILLCWGFCLCDTISSWKKKQQHQVSGNNKAQSPLPPLLTQWCLERAATHTATTLTDTRCLVMKHKLVFTVFRHSFTVYTIINFYTIISAIIKYKLSHQSVFYAPVPKTSVATGRTCDPELRTPLGMSPLETYWTPDAWDTVALITESCWKSCWSRFGLLRLRWRLRSVAMEMVPRRFSLYFGMSLKSSAMTSGRLRAMRDRKIN